MRTNTDSEGRSAPVDRPTLGGATPLGQEPSGPLLALFVGLAERVAQHFEYTDAPLGLEARRLLALAKARGERETDRDPARASAADAVQALKDSAWADARSAARGEG